MAVTFGFVAQILVVSQVQQTQSQQILLSDFRSELANAIAPTGQIDLNGALVSPGAPVAIITIAKLGMSQVIVEGTASGQTMLGPGHRRDTPLPGQAGVSLVFGRQAAYGGPFGSIGELARGDQITVVTGQGESTFAVLGVRREGDPLPPAVEAGKGRLTLVTADGASYLPDGVLRVDADLTSQVQPTPTRVLSAAALAPAEQAMQGDQSAWLAILLWSQALLAAVIALTWCLVRWGFWQAWVVGVPVLAFIGLGLGNQLAQLLPNLM